MRETGRSLGVPVHVFGNETHMTAIVAMALGKRPILSEPEAAQHTANFLLPGGQQTDVVSTRRQRRSFRGRGGGGGSCLQGILGYTTYDVG